MTQAETTWAIAPGYLPAIVLEKDNRNLEVDELDQLLGFIEDQLMGWLREAADPAESEQDRRQLLTERVETMLATLQDAGLAQWTEADAIVDEVMGQQNGAIWDMLQDEALQTKILTLATMRDETFPFRAKDAEEAQVWVNNPESWAEAIAADW